MKALLRHCMLGSIAQFIILSNAFGFSPVNKHTAAVNTNLRYLRLQLVKDAVNTDELILQFDSTANTKYNANEDAKYLQGFGQVHLFCYSADNIPLAVNVLPFPNQQADSIRLNVWAKTSGTYQLNMEQINNIPEKYDVWLLDKHNADSLDMRQKNIYSFNMDKSDSATYGANRFTLVIRQNAAYAYRLTAFGAAKTVNSKQVLLTWTTVNEQNCTRFTLERSNNNGKSYKALCEIQSAGLGEYSITDDNPAGQNVYRLKQRYLNDNITYSDSVLISFNDQYIAKNALSIYPNPVSSMINLSVGSPATGNTTYSIKFLNSSGLVIKEVTSPKPSWEGDISGLLPGVYFAQILNAKTDAIVGRKRFVKY
jgi:trimeric autotransporter adhesin